MGASPEPLTTSFRALEVPVTAGITRCCRDGCENPLMPRPRLTLAAAVMSHQQGTS